MCREYICACVCMYVLALSWIVRRLVGNGFIFVINPIDYFYPRLVVSPWSSLFVLTKLSLDSCILLIAEEIPYAEECKAAEAASRRSLRVSFLAMSASNTLNICLFGFEASKKA